MVATSLIGYVVADSICDGWACGDVLLRRLVGALTMKLRDSTPPEIEQEPLLADDQGGCGVG